MDLANKLSGLNMHLYNAEDGPYQSDSDKEDTCGLGGPKQPGDDTFDAEDEPGAAVESVDATADDEWEVVSQDPDWDMIPHDDARDPRKGKTLERDVSLNAEWVVCEKGKNGEVQMFEASEAKYRGLSSNSTEKGDQKPVSLPEASESAAPTEMRVSAKFILADASQMAQERKSGPLVVESQAPPSSQASSKVSPPNPVPSRRSYERLRPENNARSRPFQSAPAQAEAQEDRHAHAPQSAAIRISTGRIAKPGSNPNKNRPLSSDEKELPFLTPTPTVAAHDSRRQRHCRIADQLRAQANQEQAALIIEQQRMDERLDRTERALTDWYGFPHGWAPHFY